LQKTKIINKLQAKLAEMHNRKHCVIVSRGAVAIYLALRVLGFNKGKVVMPSILCLSPANAVIYAGLEPIFCDINLADFNIDIDKLEKLLKEEKDIKAIILPHIYGQPTAIDKVEASQKISSKIN